MPRPARSAPAATLIASGALLLGGLLLDAGPVRADTAQQPLPQALQLRLSQSECEPGQLGCFQDAYGRWRDPDRAYRLLQHQDPPDHLRNVIEMGVFLTGGTIWYWLDREFNAQDWDFESLKSRFQADAYRFDNNAFGVNFAWHGLTGMSYYAVSRANRLGPWGSYLSAWLTSWVWEFVIEYRERVSINDQITTPHAGLAWGEFIYKLGRYVNERPRAGLLHDMARWTVGLPQSFHDVLDRTPRPAGDAMRPDIEGRLRFYYAPTAARAKGATGSFMLHEAGFDGTLATLPGYLRPGRHSRFFAMADIASMRGRVLLGQAGGGVELFGETTLLGLHHQRIGTAGKGKWGHAITVGSHVNLLYRAESYDSFQDRLAIHGLPGLSFDAHAYWGWGSWHFGLRGNPDFAGVHSHAFREWYTDWRQDHPEREHETKTILTREDYYYGWGVSGRLFTEIHLPWVQIGASAWHGRWRSQQGLDRNQSTITHDVIATDQAFDWESWVRLLPWDAGYFFELHHAGQHRWSQIEDVSVRPGYRRTQASFGFLH